MPDRNQGNRELFEELQREIIACRLIQYRQQRVLVVLIGLMMIVPMTGAFKSERTEVLDVGALRVTNKEGKLRAEITYNDAHDSILNLYDRNGNTRICASVTKDDAKITIRDS